MNKKRTWRKGPPPHVGWWNASALRHPGMWRWWDGERWSAPVFDAASERSAACAAQSPGRLPFPIEWTDYYPEGARVPRINPND